MIIRRLTRTAATALASVGLAIWMLPASPAMGATFTVSNTNDSGAGSLRQAIADASASAGVDTVVIPAGLGTIMLSSPIDFTGTDLTTVQGNGNTVSYAAGTAFNAAGATPYALDGLVISADAGANAYNGDLTITNSTLRVTSFGANTYNGNLVIEHSTIDSAGHGANTYGGSLTVAHSTIDLSGSGAALNTYSGALVLTDSHVTGPAGSFGLNTYSGAITITGSEVVAGDGGVNTYSGTVSVANSSIIGAAASSSVGLASAQASVTLVNSTVTGWHAEGVHAEEVNLVYSTIVENGQNKGANIDAGALRTFASVVSSPADDCHVLSTTSAGYNFSNDTTCGLTGTGDVQSGGNPGLGPLADNGGNSRTFLPQSGSPLIDAVPLASCHSDGASAVTTDQRLLPRPAGAGCEVGSVELQPPPPPPVPTTTATTAGQAPVGAVVTPRFTG